MNAFTKFDEANFAQQKDRTTHRNNDQYELYDCHQLNDKKQFLRKM